MTLGAVRVGTSFGIWCCASASALAAESLVESPSAIPRPAQTASPDTPSGPPNLVVCARVADVPGTAVGPGATVPGATVILIAPDGKVFSGTAGSDGCVPFVALESGPYRVTVASPGAEPIDGAVEVIPDGTARFDAQLALVTAEGQEVVVEASREAAGETRRSLAPREVRNIPGAANDALKSVQNLPGVARAPLGIGMLVVRGSAPGDTRVFLDGQEIPQLYHFGGLNSVIPTEALSRIDFLPGGFGVRYGRTIGGVVDVETRGGRDDRWGGFFDADFYGAAGLAEGPVGRNGQNGRILAGVRRSYVDLVLPEITPSQDLNWTVAPRYYDYQLRWDMAPKESGLQSRVMVFGSDDALTFVVKKPQDDGLRGRYRFRTAFHRLQAPITRPLSDRWILSAVPSMGYQNLTLDGGGLVMLSGTRVSGGMRVEARGPITKRANLLVGVDGEVQRIGYQADYEDDGGTGASSPDRRMIAEASYASSAAGAYMEGEFDTGDGWIWTPGVRFDHYLPQGAWSFDPRLAVRWHFEKRSWAKAYTGVYHQPPDFYEWDRAVGSPELKPAVAVQSGIGGGHLLGEAMAIEGELFWKWMEDLPNTAPGDASDPTRRTRYRNGGIGRAYGLEALVRRDLTQRLAGWVSYTLSRAERANPESGWNMFRYDQTHILSAIASYRHRRGWQTSGRFRYVTGNPTTVVEEAVYDADADRYLPIPGFREERRMPSFHQLDVRLEKTWDWSGWNLVGYLDVQNVYGRLNPERVRYDFDYSDKAYITGLPIFPSIGVRGEF